MTKILVTLDGSPLSRAVMPVVARFARDLNAHIDLLIVVEPTSGTPRTRPEDLRTQVDVSTTSSPPTLEPGAHTHPPEPKWAEAPTQAVERAEHEGSEMLGEASRVLRDQGISVDQRVMMDDDPARAIIAFAKRENVDLIAMATHGRSGLREVVQGSVAEAVVKSGVAPVLLVRPQA